MIKPVAFWQRALVYFICWTFNIQPLLANVIVDNSQHNTSVNRAGNGVEVVNIATPNANGLSHNQYQQFNVDPSGLILNNSTAQVAQSQLGGYLQNNPNLHGQAATVILNEVTGASRSQLQGYTEVFGQGAPVILTNPYGITCNGCGFINTPRVTLSTGNPLIENGNVTGFYVSQGSVSIEGLGLDATHQSYFDIITRTAQLNADIHANDLSIVTGKNRVSYQSNQVTATAADDKEAAPELAIDSSNLGGMYAGRIALVATDAGVGVNVGNLSASQGDIRISADGQITLGKSSAQNNLTVSSQSDVTLKGSQYAKNNLSVEGKAIEIDHAKVVADKQLALVAPEQITLEQGIVQVGVDGNSDSSGNTLKLTTQSLQLQDSDMMSLGQLSGEAKTIHVDEQSQLAARDIVLSELEILDNDGSVYGQDTLDVRGQQLTLAGAGKITGGDISLSADSLVLDNQIDAHTLTTNALQTTIHKNLTVDQADLTADTLDLNSQIDALNLNANADSIHINHQQVLGQASLQANSLDFNHRVDAQSLDVNADSVHVSDKLALGNMTLKANHFILDSDIEAQSIQANLQTATVKQGRTIKTSGDLHLSVAQKLQNQGKVLALHDMVVDGSGDIDNRGLLYSGNDSSFYINRLTNFGAILTGSDLLIARNTDQARMASLENSSGRIESFNGSIGIYADSVLNHQTRLSITTFGHRYFSVARDGVATGNSDYDMWTDKDTVYWPATKGVGYGSSSFNGRYHSGTLYQVLSRDILPLKVAEYENRLNESSGASFLLAKNQIDIHAGQVVNDASQISGHDVTINAAQVTNRGYQIYKGATFVDYQLVEAIRGAGNVQALFDELEIDNKNGTFPLSGVYIFNSDLYGSKGKDIHYRRIGTRENVPIGPQSNIQSSITATNRLTINAAQTNNSVMSGGVNPPPMSAQPTGATTGVLQPTTSHGRQVMPSDLLPQGLDQLFIISTEPDSHYVIETDPIFTDKAQFLGSDYFRSQVNYNPAQEVKFLGDAYYDTRIITQTIFEQTGKRYLNQSVGSDTEQMAQLMDNAAKEQQSLALTVGNALTAEQVANLTHDMIWYEYTEVGGQTVLAPRLYLAKARANDISNGALLAGNRVDINTGTLANERGDIQADTTLSVDAQGDIINKSGIIVGDNVSLTSAQGSLINSTEFQTDTYLDDWVDTHVGRLGSIRAGHDLTIGVKKDIVNQGASLQAKDNLSLNAGENVEFSAIQKDKRRVFYQNGGVDITQSIRHQGASAQANHVEVNAGQNITLSRAHISAVNDATLTAKGNVNVLAVNDSDYSYSKHTHKKSFGRSKTTIHESLKETVRGSSIAAGGDITIKAQKYSNAKLANGHSDIQVVGSNLNAGDAINLSADGDVILSAQQYREYQYNQTIKKGFGGLSGSNRGNLDDATLLEGANTIAASHININSGKNIGVIASTVSAGGDVNMQALDEVLVTADNILRQTQQWDEKSSFLSGGHLMEMSSDREGMQSSTAQGSQIASHGNVNIQGGSVALVGSDVVAGENTVLKADTGHLDIRSAQNSLRKTSQHKQVSVDFPTFELLSHPESALQITDGQVRFRIGKATYDQVENQTTATMQTGSTVLANNDVSLSAAGDLTVTGSRIAADQDGSGAGDLSLAAENILIQEAKETEQTQSQEVHGKAEASLVVQHQAVEVAKAVKGLQQATQALKQARQDYQQYKKQLASLKGTLETLQADYAAKKPGVTFEDIEELQDLVSDLKGDEAWYAAGIALAAENVTSKTTLLYKQNRAAVNSITSGAFGFDAGLHLDIDADKQNSQSQRVTSVGSQLSGQNVTIEAGHQTGQSATVQGSVIHADDTLAVSGNQVNLLASDEQSSNTNGSESAHVGASVTLFGANSGVNLDASYSRNESVSQSQTHTNSVLSADHIRITSDGDTDVNGADVAANEQLDISVGGDLNVASVQNRYSSTNHGGSVSGGVGLSGGDVGKGGAVSGFDHAGNLQGVNSGVNLSNGRSHSRETMLTRITSGGDANITVGGNTDIKGATIATVNEDGSDTGRLHLETGTLSYTDLSNTRDTSSRNAGVSSSVSIGPDKDGATQIDASRNSSRYQYTNQSGYHKSKTLATVGQGVLRIEDTRNSDDTERLNRDVTSTTKDLYSVDRQQGNFDVTVDHRLLSETGWKEIKNDIKVNQIAGRALSESVSEENGNSVLGDSANGVSNAWENLHNQLGFYNAGNAFVSDGNNDKQLKTLNNPDATPEERQAAAQGLSAAIAKQFDVTPAQAMEALLGTKGAYVDGTGVIAIDSNMHETLGDIVNTIGHETMHYLDDKPSSGAHSETYKKNRETYASGMGDKFAEDFAFSYENAGLGKFGGAISPSGILFSDTTVKNTQAFSLLRQDHEVDYRALTTDEVKAIEKLAAGDSDRAHRLKAAGCVLVHCSAGYSEGSSEYQYFKGLEDEGAAYQHEQSELVGQTVTYYKASTTKVTYPVPVEATTAGLFRYDNVDKKADAEAAIIDKGKENTAQFYSSVTGLSKERVKGITEVAAPIVGAGAAALTGKVAERTIARSQAAEDVSSASNVSGRFSSQREYIEANIANSRAARDSSNFGGYSKAEGRVQEELGIWPPNRGAYGPIENMTIPTGSFLDRFGFPGGTFVSPANSPFKADNPAFETRALPSYKQNDPYNVYKVLKPINAPRSKILPWFGQPGQGVQYDLPKSVQWYIENGYLEPVGDGK
ncbi:hemagglutinin repeat-containing protein [Vibrio ruber]|uniref:two-partner secretion domain-containing protein n=1 Tax=Vibrio ruber TaxID=184755 RepID=UPI002892E32E|nr:hemagglutinin repeat-containing protein [Vibrio ruber]WNJ95700.1 hemagglutinin repeat-containing protein [Vibrio ruber]